MINERIALGLLTGEVGRRSKNETTTDGTEMVEKRSLTNLLAKHPMPDQLARKPMRVSHWGDSHHLLFD